VKRLTSPRDDVREDMEENGRRGDWKSEKDLERSWNLLPEQDPGRCFMEASRRSERK
jgi:hypothetical protein